MTAPSGAGGTCPVTGKVSFESRRAAKVWRARIPGARGQLNVYRCPHCGFLHLGHMPRDVRNGTWDKATWKGRVS